MAVKIMIDAGHGGYDNGASYNGRREKDDVLRLALAVGEILEAQGYDVEYTRTEDVYDSPVQKARIANASGADFFVSIHRNSSPTPNQYNGVQTLVYNDSGLKATMARNINSRLEDVGYRNINVDERPDLAVLRRTQMPAVLVEAGFINSNVDNNLFDTNFSQTAEAIAAGIDETISEAGLKTVFAENINMEENSDMMNQSAGENENINNGQYLGNGQNWRNSREWDDNDDLDSRNDKDVYQILVGIYRNFNTASYQMNRLINLGYFSEVYESDGLYQVRVGEYESIEEALIIQRELRDRGYDTLIVKK